MHAPAFWQADGIAARLLAPASALVAAATARRVARPGWRAPVPVICCGNASVGGAGKTTVALDLGRRLIQRGAAIAFLTRGYGGRIRTATRVAPHHDAAAVGDEALLLAALAPTYVGPDRAASARMAVAAGATVLVMDDGLQNPGLAKDLSLLVIDGAAGFGNRRVLPAGPLREPVAASAARCQAAVLIGRDEYGTTRDLPAGLPVLRARLLPAGAEFTGQRVLAFAGIGRPAKFFATVAETGAILAGTRPFADHHRFRPAELQGLLHQATALDARLLTTAKDAARLPPEWAAQIAVLDVTLAWADEAALESLLQTVA